MTAKVKCLSGDTDGFTKGSEYAVLSFGETAAMVQDDDGKITSISYAKLNGGEAWEVDAGDEKKKAPKKKEA